MNKKQIIQLNLGKFMMNKKKFTKLVEDGSSEFIDHIESCLNVCQTLDISVERVKKFITRPLMEKLKIDGMKRKIFKDLKHKDDPFRENTLDGFIDNE